MSPPPSPSLSRARRRRAVVSGLFVIAAFSVLTAASDVDDTPDYVWENITWAANFPPMDGAAPVVFDDRMWLLGGWGPSWPLVSHSEIWVSDNGNDWTHVADAPWEARHEGGVAVHDGRMWVLGGDNNQGHYQNDVWSSADGITWDLVTDDVPWADRATHYSAVFDGRMWVMGGQRIAHFEAERPTREVLHNDVWSSTDGEHWRLETANAGWAPRGQIGGSVVHDGRMWVIGGGTYDTRRYYNDVWSSADGVTWTRELAEAPWAARQYHDVAVFDDRIWVFGGYDDDGNRGDVWHSADGVNWTEMEHTHFPPRHAASVFVYDDALWLVAGNMWNDVWRLNAVG